MKPVLFLATLTILIGLFFGGDIEDFAVSLLVVVGGLFCIVFFLNPSLKPSTTTDDDEMFIVNIRHSRSFIKIN